MDYMDDYSGFGNEVLYKMVSERPRHECLDTVRSKIWIIGRAYAASIERKAGKNFKLNQASNILIDSDIDSHIAKLNNIERITTETLSVLLSAHCYLTGLFKQSTGLDKRSLASKYLHFHAPKAVFIYDSIVRNNLRSKPEVSGRRFKVSGVYDNEYESHVLRCIHYRDNVVEPLEKALVSPRKLDSMLYEYWQ